jgi:ectoine hydroxylase-related dioxygenase (phytanoyl-CoA dioxygenase family)
MLPRGFCQQDYGRGAIIVQVSTSREPETNVHAKPQLSCFMTKGYLRQEENQYLAIPRDVVLKMPVHIQQLIGYKLSQPFCGWVESDDPRVVLDPSLKDDPSGHYDEEVE